MGTTLNGTQINNTYPGLLKSSDNAAIGATEKVVGDGVGNDSTLSLGTTSASFTGTLDVSGATVTGLPVDPNTTYDLTSAQAGLNVEVTLTGSDATTDDVTLVAGTNITLTDDGSNNITIDAAGGGGAAGLESGTGSDSMQSAASLTTTAANASGSNSIALGDNAIAVGGTSNDGRTIAIGTDVNAGARFSLVIGESNSASSDGAILIGRLHSTSSDRGVSLGYQSDQSGSGQDKIGIGTLTEPNGGYSIAIGRNAEAKQAQGIGIGYNSQSRATNCVAIGNFARVDDAVRVDTVAIGYDAKAAQYSVAIGASSIAVGEASIAIGDAGAAGNYAVAIGDGAQSNNNETVAIGRNVTAINWTASTTVNQLAIANYSSLNYADDTAAASGGVALGGVYHNAGALRIRIA